MKKIEFWVPGIPASAGSKTGFTYKDKKTGKTRVAMAPASKKQKPWMADVKYIASEKYYGELIQGPVDLRIIFYFPRPKSHFGTGRNSGKLKSWAPIYVKKKPDLTKLTRAVEDALTGVIWKDDSQVVMQSTGKFFNDKPGAKIIIKELKEDF